ncbi:MAG TPA: condensation domain-containing protein [Thermoanaerobaculia bacterium]
MTAAAVTTRRGRFEVGPLAPIQEGMLFESLSRSRPGLYVSQVSCVLAGGLDPAAFAATWARLVARHAALRTGFLWEQAPQPVQVVLDEVAVPLGVEDWRDLPAAEASRRAAELLAGERRRGFDLSRPPLFRLVLVRLAEDRWRFAWTYHHLLLDGWSEAVVLREMGLVYPALAGGREAPLPPARPYADFVRWVHAQDLAAAEAFWRGALGDFRRPTPLGGRPEEDGAAAEVRARVDAAAAAGLRRLAAGARVTLGTVVQGLWAAFLARLAGERDVVFGLTVAGRPAGLAGAEAMVGVFINTLPVRVRLPAAGPFAEWLRRLQDDVAAARRFEHTPLAEVQRWSGVPRGTRLFDSLLVFQNTPDDAAEPGGRHLVEVEEGAFQGGPTAYPLSLDVEPAAELAITLTYDTARFTRETVAGWAESFAALAAAAGRGAIGDVADLDARLDEIERSGRRRREDETAALLRARLGQARRRAVAANPREEMSLR